MPHEVFCRLKYITKKEKLVKGLIFGDRYNNEITDDVITGVLVPEAEIENDKHVNDSYDLKIDDAPAIDADAVSGTDIEDLEVYKVEQEINDSEDEGDDSQSTGVAPENADNEIQPPNSDDDALDDDSEGIGDTGVVTSLGQISKPYDWV